MKLHESAKKVLIAEAEESAPHTYDLLSKFNGESSFDAFDNNKLRSYQFMVLENLGYDGITEYGFKTLEDAQDYLAYCKRVKATGYKNLSGVFKLVHSYTV
jgi:hypothetical protein